jgi:rRNA biogenesis protein RRP5
MIKKFNTSSKVWLAYAAYLLRQEKPEESRALLTRSLKSLPKHKRIRLFT